MTDEPAFPYIEPGKTSFFPCWLTKRELAAFMAMQAFISQGNKNAVLIAERSVTCADALLAELGKKK